MRRPGYRNQHQAGRGAHPGTGTLPATARATAARRPPSPWPGPVARAACAATPHGRRQRPAAAGGARRALLRGGGAASGGWSTGPIWNSGAFRSRWQGLGRPRRHWRARHSGGPRSGSSRQHAAAPPSLMVAMRSSKQRGRAAQAQPAVQGHWQRRPLRWCNCAVRWVRCTQQFCEICPWGKAPGSRRMKPPARPAPEPGLITS